MDGDCNRLPSISRRIYVLARKRFGDDVWPRIIIHSAFIWRLQSDMEMKRDCRIRRSHYVNALLAFTECERRMHKHEDQGSVIFLGDAGHWPSDRYCRGKIASPDSKEVSRCCENKCCDWKPALPSLKFKCPWTNADFFDVIGFRIT